MAPSIALSKAGTALVLGDSLSAAHNMDFNQGWVSLLEQQLRDQGCAIDIVNASISGETSAGGLTRLPPLLDRHRPAAVVIELGGNDGLRGLPVSELKRNLSEMVRLSREAGAKVLLLGIQIPTNYGRRYGQALGRVYSDLADELNLPVIPFFLDGIATDPALMQADGIHPNVQAQPLLASRVEKPLQALSECGG